jgi:deoxyxylulose-5-phosphate synthase
MLRCMPRISVTISDSLHEQLRTVAEANHRSVSNLVGAMLNDLAPMLSQVLAARTAAEAEAYIDGVLRSQEREARRLRAQLHDTLGGDPPSTNRGVTG